MILICFFLNSLQTKKRGTVRALKEGSRKTSFSVTSSDSEDEDDRWPGSDAVSGDHHDDRIHVDGVRNRHVNSNDYVANLMSKNRTISASTIDDTSTTFSGDQRRTKSDSGVATSVGDDDDAMSYPISVKIKTTNIPVQGHKEVKCQRNITTGQSEGDVTLDSVDDVDFESSLYSQTYSSSQRLHSNVFVPVSSDSNKQDVPIASVKDGVVDNLYSGSRNPKKQVSLAKYNSKTSDLEKEAKKLDKLLSSLNQDSPRASKSTKQHVADVLEDTIAQQLQRSLAIYDDPEFELSGFNPSHKEKTADGSKGIKKSDHHLEPMTVYHPEFGHFTLGENGQIMHEELRPRTTSPVKKVHSTLELNNKGDHQKGQRTHHHAIAKYYNSKMKSPRRLDSHAGQHGGVDGAGDSGKLSMSSTPSWLTQAK